MVENSQSKQEAEKPKRRTYTEDFEAFWKAYPSTANNSKQKAFAEWKRLSPDGRLAASISLTAYNRFLRKEREKRRGEPHPVIHAERYLRDGRFEGFAAEIEVERGEVWKRAILAYMLGDDWNAPEWKTGCPAPGTAGFPLTVEQVRGLAQSAAGWARLLDEYAAGDGHAEDPFNRVRSWMFEDGQRERLVASRQKALEARNKAAEEARKVQLLEREERARQSEGLRKEREAQERQDKAKQERAEAWLREAKLKSQQNIVLRSTVRNRTGV